MKISKLASLIVLLFALCGPAHSQSFEYSVNSISKQSIPEDLGGCGAYVLGNDGEIGVRCGKTLSFSYLLTLGLLYKDAWTPVIQTESGYHFEGYLVSSRILNDHSFFTWYISLAFQNYSPNSHSLTKPDGTSTDIDIPTALPRKYSGYSIDNQKRVLVSNDSYDRYLRRRVLSFLYSTSTQKTVSLPKGFHGNSIADGGNVPGFDYVLKSPTSKKLVTHASLFNVDTRRKTNLHRLLPKSLKKKESSAFASNANGDTLLTVHKGEINYEEDAYHLFITNGSTLRQIGNDSDAQIRSSSLTSGFCMMNSSGSVIGLAFDQQGNKKSFIFDKVNGMRFLDGLADFTGVDMTNAVPTCINDSGEILFNNFVILRPLE